MQGDVAFYYFTIYMYIRCYKNKIYYQDVRVLNDKNQNIKSSTDQTVYLIFFGVDHDLSLRKLKELK
tara:strand:- start:733 stop:933 length:201 start_codon:yes stop_codon:yes gene_type:complete